MKAIIGVIIFSLALLLSGSAMAADTFKDPAAMKKFGDEFMGKVGTADLKAAYKILRPYVSMNDVEFDAGINESNKARQQNAMQYGPVKGYEFVREMKVGTVVYGLDYLEITEKQALVWSFSFIKAGDTWRLDEFYWNDRSSMLFN